MNLPTVREHTACTLQQDVFTESSPTSSTLIPGSMPCWARQSTNGMPSELACASVSLYKMAPIDASFSPSEAARACRL